MKILALGIHPDDVELGCGGTVILAVRQGHSVIIVDLSKGSASSNGTPEERFAESEEAARLMGVEKRLNLDLPDTRIKSEDEEQTARVVTCLRENRPDLIIVPSSDDPHPDHESGGRLIERAVYLAGVHGYDRERPVWRVARSLIYPGRTDLTPDVVVDVTSTHAAKMEAIRVHRSQFVPDEGRKPTPLNTPDFLASVEARSRVHGREIGVPFGEGFRTTRPLALSDFVIFGK